MDTPALHTVDAQASAWSPPLPDAPGFEHLMVETPGLRTHVAVLGGGAPIVLLHGFPQHWWQWHTIAPRLAEHGYRAICPDLRGAGWTEADDPRIRRDTRLHDLTALLGVLGIDRLHLLCHDMGAITGGQFAYSQPERVESMVMLSVPPMFMSFSPKLLSGLSHLPPLSLHRRGRSLAWLFTDEYAAQGFAVETVESYLAPMQRAEIDGAVGRLYRGMILPEAGRLVSGTYKTQRLHPPTLIVFGRRDEPFTEELVRHISGDPAQFADHVEFAFVDDAAHFITDDAPDAVAELVLDWFDRTA
ncbi:alpha/beta fold hydrolase [Agromyces italicus]|uniref:alpha/beta fold hydrolase n=1 Tax=Agromyces italicus TaxID=279572 RepID=UPI0003B3EE82|nr:alpha/beta hydrolase [Agromyces italicus]